MKTVNIRSVVLGSGKPKVIVPLCEQTTAALPAAAQALGAGHADLVEWRVDAVDGAQDLPGLLAALPVIRAALGSKPLLVTCRTVREGGAAALSPAAYVALCQAFCSAGGVDLLDVELSAGDAAFAQAVAVAHAAGCLVVGSSHDFGGTPPQQEMVHRLCRMQALGADLAKLAVMPHDRRDVAALLAATAEMTELHSETPVITMSMGALGLITRLTGEAFGSAATFAAAGRTSAPGQPALDAAQQILDALHTLSV